MDWDGYDFSLWGPSELKLSSWPHSWDLRDYPELQKKVDKALRLTVTAPDGMKGRRPVLIFFNGFLAQSEWYRHIVRRAASWGYVVVQYDSPVRNQLSPNGVKNEELLFEPLLTWLDKADAGRLWQEDPNGGSPKLDQRLQGRLDLSRVVVAGHSRGGKLAALMFTDQHEKVCNRIRAAYLLDPVDKFGPKAREALQKERRRLGVTFCGVMGPFNPRKHSYQAFSDAAPPGSWLVLLPRVMHVQLFDTGDLQTNWRLEQIDGFPDWLSSVIIAKGLDVLDIIMGQLDSDKLKMLGVNPDKMSELRHIGQEIKQFRPSQAPEVREKVPRLTAALMLTWFDHELKQSAFMTWVSQEGDPRLRFAIKHSSKVTPT